MAEVGDLLQCKWCAKTFCYSANSRLYCSYPCRKDANIQRGKDKWARENPQPAIYEFECDCCATPIVRATYLSPGRYGRFCNACRLERKAARYRKKTVRRQGIARPATVYFDDVLARDGAVCWLCKEVIDLTLLCTSRMGATLDHVIPVSKGGDDSFDNLRLAHWICNNKKSNKIVEVS